MPQSGKLYQVIFYDDLMLDDDNLLVEAEPLIQTGEEKREREEKDAPKEKGRILLREINY